MRVTVVDFIEADEVMRKSSCIQASEQPLCELMYYVTRSDHDLLVKCFALENCKMTIHTQDFCQDFATEKIPHTAFYYHQSLHSSRIKIEQ